MASFTWDAFQKAARIAEGVRRRILHDANRDAIIRKEGQTGKIAMSADVTEDDVEDAAIGLELCRYEDDWELRP